MFNNPTETSNYQQTASLVSSTSKCPPFLQHKYLGLASSWVYVFACNVVLHYYSWQACFARVTCLLSPLPQRAQSRVRNCQNVLSGQQSHSARLFRARVTEGTLKIKLKSRAKKIKASNKKSTPKTNTEAATKSSGMQKGSKSSHSDTQIYVGWR